MDRCDFALWAPPGYDSLGPFTGGPLKAVWHRTQGANYAGAWATYKKKRVCPHFTLDTNGVLYQHFEVSEGSFSLANDQGGVQTNRDGAIQVEVVGFSGESMTDPQRQTAVRLMAWLRDHHGIPWDWPMGRPPLDAASGYGKHTPWRSPETWDSVSGHYGHSQVPENSHWDPAWTDQDWLALAAPPQDNTERNLPRMFIVIVGSEGYFCENGIVTYLGGLGDVYDAFAGRGVPVIHGGPGSQADKFLQRYKKAARATWAAAAA